VTENELQLSVAKYLRVMEKVLSSQGINICWHHSPNEGKNKLHYYAKQKRLGVRKGWPDIEIIYRGRFIGIELKTKKGRVSEAQKKCHDDIILAGGVVTICRSLNEVIEFMETACGYSERVDI
jgi:hypothetical protein